jgi:hypothetical protein|tara:strand:+ start:626 stop:1486 length:861 start_codon:yes stop_codon:yes gene_type:complete
MATNKYFNNFAYAREQDLVEDLTIEAIKIYGHNVKYLPKTISGIDHLFGEDKLLKYETAADVEMYVKNVEGFEGEGEFMSKFGVQLNDQLTLTVARKRFDQIRTEKLQTEVGYNYVQESANTDAPSRQFLTGNSHTESIVLETGTTGVNNYSITSERPQEGDLVFFPLVNKIFEIKFVEHEDIFYQTGRLQSYDLRCELFKYSSEQIRTGNTDIDSIETAGTLDTLLYELLLEDGNKLLEEEGDSIVQEYQLFTQDAGANNSFFQSEGESIIDFSERNPFSEVDRF